MNSVGQGPTQAPEPTLAAGPLFVVSMWRSGSSLLYALLNKHPQVALMFEADLMLLRPLFFKPKAFCDWAERWEFWSAAFDRHGLSTADVDDGISDFHTAFTAVHQLFARRHGATIWGAKSPNYYDHLNQMASEFPEARFIIVWRDPNATVNSILRAGSLGNSYFGRRGAALCGLLGYEVFKKECDRLITRGKPVCQINYEDLISDTPAAMRQVCEFLRIPYDDSLSNLEGADRSAILNGRHHANIKGNKIVQGSRPELANVALRAKISRYVAWWHQLYGADWPPYPQPADHPAQPPNRFSRLLDWTLYRVLRTGDRISPLIFSFIPIPLLRRYRELKKRRREANGIVQPGPVDWEGSSGRAR